VKEPLVDTDKVKDMLGSSPASRRNFLKIAAMAGAGLGLGGVGVALPAHAATDDPPTIVGVALTAELLAVAFQTNALANASAIGLTANEVTTIQAILAQEALHVRYLQAYGAVPAYGTNAEATFVLPAGTFSSRTGYANAAVLAETAFVAAYMAATRDFAADGRADLAQLTYQLGAVEAEHRALARVIGGYVPYSDVAFELNLLGNVAQAATVLTNLGIIPTGTPPAGAITIQYFDVLTTNAINNYATLLTKTTPGDEPTG
jgi:hypothetical protein